MADNNKPEHPSIEERIARLEKTAHDLIDKQLRVITIVFSLVSAVIVAAGVLVSVLAIYGKIEVRDATREMERKFEVLAGRALKIPVLRILYEGDELNQKTITVKPTGKSFSLSEIQLKNTGDRATDFVSIRMQFVEQIHSSGYWQSTAVIDKEFKSASFHGGPFQISRQETWIVPAFTGSFAGEVTAETRVKLQVFYGQERPAEAQFTIKVAR